MSLNDITRYVRQTPGNTNPSVIASMVNAEMNSTLEEAKKYTDSQRLGYTEPNVLTFDGNPDNIVNEYMVKISDNVYDLNSIVSITFQMGDKTNKFDKSVIIHNDELSVGTEEYPAMVASFGDVVANILGIEPGTYFFYSVDPESNEKYYVSRVEFAETVHQIDPKFIPGVTLSEVTITEIQEFNSEENYPLSAETSAVLDALLAKKKPIIVTIKLEF